MTAPLPYPPFHPPTPPRHPRGWGRAALWGEGHSRTEHRGDVRLSVPTSVPAPGRDHSADIARGAARFLPAVPGRRRGGGGGSRAEP